MTNAQKDEQTDGQNDEPIWMRKDGWRTDKVPVRDAEGLLELAVGCDDEVEGWQVLGHLVTIVHVVSCVVTGLSTM